MLVILDWSVSLHYYFLQYLIFGTRVLVAIYLYCGFVEHTLLSQFLPIQQSKLE